MLNGDLIFIGKGKDNIQHCTGEIIYCWNEEHEFGTHEQMMEPYLKFPEDVEAVVNFVKNHFPKGWRIEKGEIVGI